MTEDLIKEIRERYKDRTSKMKLSQYYGMPIKTIVNIVAGIKMNVKRTPDFIKARNKREDIILMYLKGFKKVEIEARTGISAYFITTFIRDFETKTTPPNNVTSNLEAIRRQESKLIEMAEELSRGKGCETKYKVLLSVHASAEPFNGGVFEV